MAKSPITKYIKPVEKVVAEDTVAELDMEVVLHPKGQRKQHHNLKEWCYKNCDLNEALVRPSRLSIIKKIYNLLKSKKNDRYSDGTILGYLRVMRAYIIFCDKCNLKFFNKEGYLAFCGNGGELERQMAIANNQKPYMFMYEDGESVGISEKTLGSMKSSLNAVMAGIGFNVLEFQIHMHVQVGSKKDTTIPYDSQEWELMLRRLNYYFLSLASQLIAFRNENPGSPPPNNLDAIIDYIDGKPIIVNFKRGENTKKCNDIADSSPFVQCMMAGVLLFSYYTAFNTTSILTLRHPIIEKKMKEGGKTLEYTRVKAYKGRSRKDVQAIFTSSVDESEHSEWNENTDKPGYIMAEMRKRDNNNIQDGLTFVRLLETFSTIYSESECGYIFYAYSQQNSMLSDYTPHCSVKLSAFLGLYSTNRVNIANHLIGVFYSVVNGQQRPDYSFGESSTSCFRIVRKKIKKLPPTALKKQAIDSAWTAITCLTSTELKGVVMPLKFSSVNERGFVDVSFYYENQEEGHFEVEEKYITFLKDLSEFSLKWNPLPPLGTDKGKPAYLLPLGRKYNTHQWSNKVCLTTASTLMSLGIRHGDFLLDCNPRRIRATTSNLEYSEKDMGFSARQILQHQTEVQDKNYPNGHPDDNSRMIYQGINVLIEILTGINRDDAIERVKTKLDIPIIEYEKYIERNMPTNPNGILCNSRPDLVDTKDYHYSARKFATKEGIISEGGDIPCYQYDLCVFCKSAQLVDEPYAIYKLISFIDALSDAISLHSENAVFFLKKIAQFEAHLENIPIDTLFKAESLLKENGRYFMFKPMDSVVQHMSFL